MISQRLTQVSSTSILLLIALLVQCHTWVKTLEVKATCRMAINSAHVHILSFTRKCTTLWGRASYYGYMHMNRLSFTLKWWAESLAFMSVVYARTWSDLQPGMYNFMWSASSLPLMVSPKVLWQTRSKVPWALNLNRLRYSSQRCTLAVAQALPFT